jgi:SAM-dependent methyltransferase
MRFVPYTMWAEYFQLLLALQDVWPEKLLDVCCGTGTMCELLDDDGKVVHGFDLAPGMIAEAKRKAVDSNRRIRYEVQDARTFNMNEQYEACFSFFDSLNNILVLEELGQVFERVAAHLPPGGSWIFDLNTAYAFEKRMFDQKDLKPRSKLKYNWVGDYDPGTKIIEVKMQFWWQNEEFLEIHRQRAYSIDEVSDLLEAAGFVDVHPYHSYTLDRPRKNSDRLHWIAIKGD